MKVYFVVLSFFLLAFTGLAAGLLLKRKGLRGGCGSATDPGEKCQCKAKAGTLQK
jgi:hypothetical protein